MEFEVIIGKHNSHLIIYVRRESHDFGPHTVSTLRPCLVAIVPFRCPIQMTVSKWREGDFHSRNGRPTEWNHRNQTGP